jgi:hypothetical protein
MSLLSLFFISQSTAAKRSLPFVLSALALATAIYLHPVFLVFAGVCVLFAWHGAPDTKTLIKHIGIAGCIVLICLTPLLYQMATLAARSESLFFARSPALTAVLKAIFPPFPVVAFLTAGVCTGIFFKSFRFVWQRQHIRLVALLLLWLVSGPLLYYVHAQITGHSLFLPRIMFWRLPALALLTALLVSCVQPVLTRNFLVLLFSILTITGYGMRPWHMEEWRETAVASTGNPDARVALFSGLIELDSLAWVTNPSHHDYLAAPYSVYAPTFKNTLLLPRNPHDPDARLYIVDTVIPQLHIGDQLVMYLTYRHNEPTYAVHEKLIEIFGQHGISLTPLEEKKLVRRYQIQDISSNDGTSALQ